MQMDWPLQRELQSMHSIGKNDRRGELLGFVLEQAMLASNATGAAIALGRGKEMFCWAAQGTAPELGMPLDSRLGLSGLCLQKGRALLCDDAERDPRVDRMACRQLGVRSVIAVPLLHHGKPVGVLEVLSRVAHAFDDNDVRRLGLLAKMTIEGLADMAATEIRVIAV